MSQAAAPVLTTIIFRRILILVRAFNRKTLVFTTVNYLRFGKGMLVKNVAIRSAEALGGRDMDTLITIV